MNFVFPLKKIYNRSCIKLTSIVVQSRWIQRIEDTNAVVQP